MNNRIILIVVILIILIPLILVNRESFKICSSNNLFNQEYICKNYNTCCSNSTQSSCYCQNPTLKKCLDNEKECNEKFCQNLGKTQCNEFCKKRKDSCCKYIGGRISNADIENRIPKQGSKDSNTYRCKINSPNIDHFKCGRICYSDPKCTGYSIMLKNTCKLYGKDDKLIQKRWRYGDNPNFPYYGKI